MPKYIFNKETLSYEEVRSSRHFRITKGAVLFAGSIVMAVFWIWLYSDVFGFTLPKTAVLEKTNARLVSKLELLSRQVEKDGEYLASMQLRDNDIYRSVFGMNEIPSEIRNAGFGGVDRYSYLDGIDRTGLLKRPTIWRPASRRSLQSIRTVRPTGFRVLSATGLTLSRGNPNGTREWISPLR